MKRTFGLEQVTYHSSSILTVGTFDGVHRGHQVILKYLVERALDRQARSIVVTFDPHPRVVLNGQAVSLLTSIDERLQAIEDLGIDECIVLPFTTEFAALSPESFVRDILVKRIGFDEIVVGYDHAFGRQRQGNDNVLRELGAAYGFSVDVISAQEIGSEVVSSTQVRKLLEDEGHVRDVASKLGRCYRLAGKVVRGDGRGGSIGFPTANIETTDPHKVIPKRGVYAVLAYLPGINDPYAGMMNIGVRPTFKGTSQHLEVHILDFDQDLYGEKIEVEFIERLRNEQKFESVDALIAQLTRDRENTQSILNHTGNSSSSGGGTMHDEPS